MEGFKAALWRFLFLFGRRHEGGGNRGFSAYLYQKRRHVSRFHRFSARIRDFLMQDKGLYVRGRDNRNSGHFWRFFGFPGVLCVFAGVGGGQPMSVRSGGFSCPARQKWKSLEKLFHNFGKCCLFVHNTGYEWIVERGSEPGFPRELTECNFFG